MRNAVSIGQYVEALHDFAGKNATQLSFKANDILCVTHTEPTGQWFKGYVEGKPDVAGHFPVNVVRELKDYVPKDLQEKLQASFGSARKDKEKDAAPHKEQHKEKAHKSAHKKQSSSSKVAEDVKSPVAALKAEARPARSMSIGSRLDEPPALPPPLPDDGGGATPKRHGSSSTPASMVAKPAKAKKLSKASGMTSSSDAPPTKDESVPTTAGSAAADELRSPRAAVTIDSADLAIEYEDRVRSKEVVRDALASELLLFPANDVRVVNVPRAVRQCVASSAAPVPPPEADEHVKIALAASVRDFVVVQRKTREALAKTAPTPLQSSDSRDKDTLLLSPMKAVADGRATTTTMTTLPKDADREYHDSEHFRLLTELQKRRRRFFEVYVRTERADPIHLRAPLPLPEAPRPAVQLRVTLLKLKLAVDVGEAFFLALALYDLRTRQKLSETWHVDVNDDSVLLQFQERKSGSMHPETRARSALFGVAGGAELSRERARDIVLVARIERVACADVDAGVDMYCRGELKPKDAEKARAAAEAARTLLGNVLQPFAWTYVRPFADDDSAAGSSSASDSRPYELRTPRTTLSFERLFKLKADRLRDDVLCDELRKRDESTDKSALVPGTLECAVAIVHANVAPPAGRLDASLRLLQPTPDDDVKLVAKHRMPRTPLVRELCAFGAARVPGVQLEYVNQLHVQCEWLDFHNLASAANARNIVCAVSLRLDDRQADAPGAELVYGGASLPRLVTEAVSPLTYKTRRPQFYFEAKIELPVVVPRGAHLLFTFRHVACRLKTAGLFSLEAKEDASCVLGYACLPLLAVDARDDQPLPDVDVDDDAAAAAPAVAAPASTRAARDGVSPLQLVADGEHLLSVAKTLPPHYLQSYVDETPQLAWVDKKPVFQCRTTLTSSVHTNSAPLALFFSSAKEGVASDELRNACRQLANVDVALLTSHFASVADQLVAAIALGRSGAKWAFVALVELVARIDQHTRGTGKSSTRNALLDAYVHYLCVGGDAGRIMHKLPSAFVDAWLKFLDDADARNNSSWYSVAWFLLSLLGKTIAVECAYRNALDDSHARHSRLPEATASALRQLVDRLAGEMLTLSTRTPAALAALNRTMALLFSDLFGICDRGFVLQLVLQYVRRLRQAPSSAGAASTRTLLARLRLEQHALLSGYEHYVQLNLPLPFEFRSAASMRGDWWRRHVLVGLLIDECADCLDSDERLPKHTAAGTVRLVLVAQARVAGRSADAQRRVVDMFFPLVQLLCDHVDHIVGAEEDDDGNGANSASQDDAGALGAEDTVARAKRSETSQNLQRRASERRTLRNPPTVTSKAFGLLGVLRSKKQQQQQLAHAPPSTGSQSSGATPSEQKPVDEVTQGLIESERSDWLASMLYVVSECSPELLTKWMRHESSARLSAFCALVAAAVRRFAGDGCADLLARETCAAALTIVALLMTEVQKEIARNDRLRRDVFGVVVEVMTVVPPVDLLLESFSLVRRFLHEHAKLVFLGQDTNYAADMCVHVLRYCGSPNDEVRSNAAALWLRLATVNMRVAGNFSRVKLRSTVAMSSLAGGTVELDSGAMKSALEAVVRHASADDGKRSWALNSHASLRHDKPKDGAGAAAPTSTGDDDEGASFDAQLKELTARLFGVIKNSNLLADAKGDPETEADLLHRLSINHVDSPVLRVTWLVNLAAKHVERLRWTEAGCCYALIASLSAAYLRKRGGAGDLAGVPPDDSVFHALCAQIKSEPGLPESQQPGIYESPVFSREGLCSAVQSALGHFLRAELYELAIKLYGVLVTLYVASDDYGRLARAAIQLPTHCEKLLSLRANEARIFAQYYCVSMHGEPWKERDGRHYIFKAPAAERIAEFTESLSARYAKRMSPVPVRVLAATESADAIKKRLASEKGVAFVQIAAVRPHASSNTKRKTEFDMHQNVSRFAVELPFVPGGGSYASTAKQWKRRVVFKCTSTFPHVVTCLLVDKVDEKQLSPLACAIETIGGRADQLREEVQAQPPDLKQLQLLLQGSVLLQVNAGPLEIATTFLRADFVAAKDDLAPGEKADALQTKLRAEFRRFIEAAADAVQLNGTLIEANQAEFQEELEKGLERTRATLNKILGE